MIPKGSNRLPVVSTLWSTGAIGNQVARFCGELVLRRKRKTAVAPVTRCRTISTQVNCRSFASLRMTGQKMSLSRLERDDFPYSCLFLLLATGEFLIARGRVVGGSRGGRRRLPLGSLACCLSLLNLVHLHRRRQSLVGPAVGRLQFIGIGGGVRLQLVRIGCRWLIVGCTSCPSEGRTTRSDRV